MVKFVYNMLTGFHDRMPENFNNLTICNSFAGAIMESQLRHQKYMAMRQQMLRQQSTADAPTPMPGIGMGIVHACMEAFPLMCNVMMPMMTGAAYASVGLFIESFMPKYELGSIFFNCFMAYHNYCMMRQIQSSMPMHMPVEH